MSLETFDFEPAYQPDPDNKVSFKLKPLDLRGHTELLYCRDEDGFPNWKGLVSASRYIVGWSGGNFGPFSRARVRQIVDGEANANWAVWLPELALKLFSSIRLPEDDEKNPDRRPHRA